MKKIIWILIAVVLALAASWFFYHKKESAPELTNPPANSDRGVPVKMDLVQLDQPAANAIVKSPLAVSGKARGFWYFEAQFPVKILDANGQVLGQTPAHALGEWMTTELVPFAATLTFKTPTTDTGTLVLAKDNPSGLPQNDQEFRYPIRFR